MGILAFAVCCHAAEPFGEVTHLEGDPKVIRRLKPIDVAKGDDLFLGDRVRTKVTDKLEIKTTYDDIILVAPRTSMVLKNQSKDGKKKEIFLELLGGTIRNKVNPLKKDEVFLVRTPVTVAGVRGTDFTCDSTGRTVVFEGKVEVSALTDRPTVEEQLNEAPPSKTELDDPGNKVVAVEAKQEVKFDPGQGLSESQRMSNLEVKAIDKVFEIKTSKLEAVESNKNQSENQQQKNDKKTETEKSESSEKTEENEEKKESNTEGDSTKESSTTQTTTKDSATTQPTTSGTQEGTVTTQSETSPGEPNLNIEVVEGVTEVGESTDTTEIILEFIAPNIIQIESVETSSEIPTDILETVVEDVNSSAEEQTLDETQSIITEIQKETFILKFQLQHRNK